MAESNITVGKSELNVYLINDRIPFTLSSATWDKYTIAEGLLTVYKGNEPRLVVPVRNLAAIRIREEPENGGN